MINSITYTVHKVIFVCDTVDMCMSGCLLPVHISWIIREMKMLENIKYMIIMSMCLVK